ncbi:response regulator transcription factor [Inquilinus sp. Marseille-Q2685]|uniref:LuxR C-terminal-related transcriptional regulator n=1 Tax=Inquilinus sp. Marseille-Q2685 TaxID=2866581 RepID=UPI001CE43288|nr:response regulator transcription factor [Inquilinus sp. Marseille-Q2685]
MTRTLSDLTPALGGAEANPIRIGFADKNPLVLRGLQSLFGEDRRFELVVSASDGERFLDAVARFELDVGIIGWVMANGDGRAVLEGLRDRESALARGASPRIVVYTGADLAVARLAMQLGAAGFLSKSEPPERLLDVVAEVARGRMMFPFLDLGRALADDPLACLTVRERELLERLAEGLSNEGLARRFGLSPNTVKFHLRNLYEKLGAANRAQAVAVLLGRDRG